MGAFVVEGGAWLTIFRHIICKDAAPHEVGTYILSLHLACHVHGFSFLVESLEGYSASCASDQIATLGIECDVEAGLLGLESSLPRARKNLAVAVVAIFLWSLVHCHHARPDRAVVAKEVLGHLPVVKQFAILAVVGAFGHAEVHHPSGVGPELIIARAERVGQREVSMVGIGPPDVLPMPLDDMPLRIHQLHIEDVALRCRSQACCLHQICLIPNRVAQEVAVVVQVQIGLLLHRSGGQAFLNVCSLCIDVALPATYAGKGC